MTDERPDDDLEGALSEAFKPEPGESVLGAISRLHGAGDSILLRETNEEDSPILFKGKKSEAKDDSRYQIVGEIARGGIGIVYRGRDKDLNRDIALKVLRPEFANRPDVIDRFIEEAQVGGQLQHPGIVPIYGLALQPDGRPSFAMKLIKGRTLAEMLDTNLQGIDLLSVFEQIALTMAYTHSRGVIHRDLKPANIMVGAFGEVQVVDWGFGKVLGRAEQTSRPGATIVATVRSGASGTDSLAGSVMGTPAYMPPEQALGHVDDLDEHADVFALGAILCEILTGRAPYTGEIKDQLIAASQSRLDEAYAALDAADVADALKELARDCLQPLTKDRPRNASVVADRMSSHFAAVDERARESEIEAIETETRIEREQKKHKRAVVLATAAMIAIVTLGGGYFWWKASRDAREEKAAPLIAGALLEATRNEGVGDWSAAVASAQRAVDTARAEGVDDAESQAVLLRLDSERKAHESEARIRVDNDLLLAELVGIRSLAPGSTKTQAAESADGSAASNAEDAWDRPSDRHKAMDAAYTSAFQRRGFPLDAANRNRLRDRLKVSRHAEDFAANISYWSWLRKNIEALEGSDWESLHRLAHEIDPKPEHVRVRDALLADDADALIDAVGDVGDLLPLALVSQVAMALIDLDRPDDAIEFLHPWLRRHPDEMVIHLRIAIAARAIARNTAEIDEDERQEQYEVAIRHASAAVAIRPELGLSWYQLGRCLASAREFEGAIDAFRHVIELTPGYRDAYDQLVDTYARSGQHEDALATVDSAIEAFPGDASLHRTRGWILSDRLDRHADAIATYLTAIELSPDTWSTYTRLALAYALAGEAAAARAQLDKALEIAPDSSAAVHTSVARCLLEMKALDEVLDHARQALEIDSSSYLAHIYIGFALGQKGELDEAIAAYEAAIEVAPGSALARMYLSTIYERKRDYRRSLELAREAVELSPTSARAHAGVGVGLLAKRDYAGAANAFRNAIALEPSVVRHHRGLAVALAAAENWYAAVDAYRTAIELAPNDAGLYVSLGAIQCDHMGKYDAAISTLKNALALDPSLAVAWFNIGIANSKKGSLDAALVAFRKAEGLDQHPGRSYMLGRTLINTGDWTGAIDAFRECIKRAAGGPPSYAILGHAYLGLALSVKGDIDSAQTMLKKAIALGPEDSLAHALLASLLSDKGDLEGAVGLLTRAVDLNAGYADELNEARRVADLATRLPAVLEGKDKPADADEALVFARLARTVQKDDAGSMKLYAEAFRLDPSIADDPTTPHRYNAACVAVLAGEASHAQALEWLRLDLAALEEAIGSPSAHAFMRMWLAERKLDPDLASVRDVDDLPADWNKFWADLDRLIARVKEAAK